MKEYVFQPHKPEDVYNMCVYTYMAVRHEARLVHSRFLPAAKRTRVNRPCAGTRVRTRSDAPCARARALIRSGPHQCDAKRLKCLKRTRSRPTPAHKVKKSKSAQG